jgi:hypothetical protein
MAAVTSLKRFWTAWKHFGEVIAGYVAVAIFAVLYVIAFAPIAILLKLRGRRFLPVFRGDEATYFLPKDKIEPTMEFMKKQG